LTEAICRSMAPTTPPVLAKPTCQVEGLDADQVVKTLETHKDTASKCFEKKMAADTDYTGTSWSVSLSRKGASLSSSSSAADAELRKCLRPVYEALKKSPPFDAQTDYSVSCTLRHSAF